MASLIFCVYNSYIGFTLISDNGTRTSYTFQAAAQAAGPLPSEEHPLLVTSEATSNENAPNYDIYFESGGSICVVKEHGTSSRIGVFYTANDSTNQSLATGWSNHQYNCGDGVYPGQAISMWSTDSYESQTKTVWYSKAIDICNLTNLSGSYRSVYLGQSQGRDRFLVVVRTDKTTRPIITWDGVAVDENDIEPITQEDGGSIENTGYWKCEVSSVPRTLVDYSSSQNTTYVVAHKCTAGTPSQVSDETRYFVSLLENGTFSQSFSGEIYGATPHTPVYLDSYADSYEYVIGATGSGSSWCWSDGTLDSNGIPIYTNATFVSPNTNSNYTYYYACDADVTNTEGAISGTEVSFFAYGSGSGSVTHTYTIKVKLNNVEQTLSNDTYSCIYDGHSRTVELYEDGVLKTSGVDWYVGGTQVVSGVSGGIFTHGKDVCTDTIAAYVSGSSVAEIGFEIAAKQLTITGTSVADKVYDGTASATITLGTVSGICDGDDVDILADGEFEDGDVYDYVVDITYSIDPNSRDGGNYIAPTSDAVSAEITQRTLTLTGTVVDNKEYDGNTSATIEEGNAGTLGNFANGESFSLQSVSASFDTKNVGTGKRVTVRGTIPTRWRDNYAQPIVAEATASITPKGLTVTGTTVEDKTYDGTTDATVNPGTLNGVIGNDDVAVTATAAFEDETVGTAKNVIVTYLLSGSDKDNYSISSETLNADIYSAVSPTIDNVTITNYSGIYDGQPHTIALSDPSSETDTIWYSSDGTDYTLTDPPTYTNAGSYTVYIKVQRTGYSDWLGSGTVSIGQKKITVTGTVVADKGYDGTVNVASADITLGTTNVIAGDRVTVTPYAEFETADAGVGKTVSLSYSISGQDVGNYSSPDNGTTSATITKKSITLVGATVTTKPYDGTTVAEVTGGTLDGVLQDDTVVIGSRSGAFEDAAAGENKRVTITVVLRTTGEYRNYEVSGVAFGTISRKQLHVTGTQVSSQKYYDGTSDAKVLAVGSFDSGDVVAIGNVADDVRLNAVANYSSNTVGENKTITVTYSITGKDAANYIPPVSDNSFRGDIIDAHVRGVWVAVSYRE